MDLLASLEIEDHLEILELQVTLGILGRLETLDFQVIPVCLERQVILGLQDNLDQLASQVPLVIEVSLGHQEVLEVLDQLEHLVLLVIMACLVRMVH